MTVRVDDIDGELDRALTRLSEPGRSAARRIVSAGGKRLRPGLLLSCAGLGGDPAPAARSAVLGAAAAVELLHSATLVHDDLLDGSETRRGVPAVHRLEGQATAVIVGDALIAQSWLAITRSGADNAVDLATALADMCVGEELEAELAFDRGAAAADVLRVAQLKTGALLRAACRIGGRLGGLPEDQLDVLGAYGTDLGVALQLVDDVLDVVSEPALLGKPCGADFVAGTVTMPTVFALADGPGAAELAGLLRPGLSGSECARARVLLTTGDGARRTADLAHEYAGRAARGLSSIVATAAAGAPEALERARTLMALPTAYVDAQLRSKVAVGVDLAGPPPGAAGTRLTA